MTVIVEGYRHETGEHCASTALRNILAYRGQPLSEGMIFGLASGVGFIYLESEDLSPSRMFHGRTASLEEDFARNTGADYVERPEDDDAVAWQTLRERIAAGQPVMLSTDTFYLGYHNTTSHFPGHRCVAVGYDDDSQTVLIADRKFEEYQRCSYEDLRLSRNAPDYPMTCENRYTDFGTTLGFDRPLDEAIVLALSRNARAMLEPEASALPSGVPAMRNLARSFSSWTARPDWSWCARFGYQVIIKRGAAGCFFRPLEVDFLREAATHVPELSETGLAAQMESICEKWSALAAVLKVQSEREHCDPEIFATAGDMTSRLADAEERFFSDALAAVERIQ